MLYEYLGACGTLIGHPMDTIKTWQQAGNTRIVRTIYEIILRNNGVFIYGFTFIF